jgi:L-aspartate oxidase
MDSERTYSQVLVIGAGLAGCVTALSLADSGFEVTLIAAGKEEEDGNSWLAQGGIIYKALSGDPGLLERDILRAGHRHNSRRAVRFLAEKGPEATEKILFERLNIPFARQQENDAGEGEWDLTREGGHSSPRILHCADHTGRSIMQGFAAAVQSSPQIRFLRSRHAVDLLTSHHHSRSMTHRYQLNNVCCGAYVFNAAERRVETLLADYTVLATGGVGQLYLHSTNHAGAVGSAISMASRAFVRLENLEYVQFHPTAFYHQDSPRFLITEAMRGEGAVLLNAGGERFMPGYDARAELAPRDVVSQAIATEMLQSGHNCVYLDPSGIRQDLARRFPTITRHCLQYHVDINKDLIPVVPAAHYFCGGILTDLAGRTSLRRLYSVGECACTGLHGANRLASTSLLEALVWGYGAARDIARQLKAGRRLDKRLREDISDWSPSGSEHNDDPALLAQDWVTIRSTMWNYVGIIRTGQRLYRAFEEMRDLSTRVHNFYRLTPLSKPLLELFQGCQAAYMIIQAALRNQRSLGCHQRRD